MSEANNIPRLLSAREVAEQTGLSVWSVYELARENRLPHRRLGRKIVFTGESVARFFAAAD